MKKQKIPPGLLLTGLLWLVLAAGLWLGPKEEISEAERRPLAQMPEISPETVLSGRFMTDFEAFTQDQFPLRDGFRTVKSLFHLYVLNQSDNNGIYLAGGHGVKQEYPLDTASLHRAADRFSDIYERYLRDCAVYMAVVPDKGWYLAEDSDHLSLDFGELTAILRERMPWATHIDLSESLNADDYYRTDIHWRQENLLDTAGVLCEAMGVTPPQGEDYTLRVLERPFYGIYYGQAALPMEPDELCLLENEMLAQCRVYDFESGSYTAVYDMEKLDSRDLYDVFLSGSRSLLTVENPNAGTARELIVFRDSFGSAIVPLLLQDYAAVTLVDIRYIQPELLDRFLDFREQDVLFLYSTSVLNNSTTIK